MLCKACSNLFRPFSKRLIKLNELIVHQISPEDVRNSFLQGCSICTRLWEQACGQIPEFGSSPKHHPNRSRLVTKCQIEEVRDKLESTLSSDKTESYERLVSTGLLYKTRFSWEPNEGYIVLNISYRLEAAERISKFVGNYQPSESTNSVALWELAKQWLDCCQRDHLYCKADSDDWMPTRLLDLCPSKSSCDIKLVSSREDPPDTQQGLYMTLSHCWGKSEVLQLTENTIDMLRAGISVKQLPTLYQEAVDITRKLGIRYLWIDSLCIIQCQKMLKDSDWLREASMMGMVYSNSYCNIAAMDAEDSFGQCFFERQAGDVRPHEVIVEWHDNGPMPFYLIDERSMETGFSEDKPLSKRAWVLQEQLLAPRALLFGKTQVHWQCRTHTACETFPLGLPESRKGEEFLRNSVFKSPVHFLKRWIAAANPVYCYTDGRRSPWECFWLSWKTVVEDYNRRLLTFSTDKLAAIAGVAGELERKQRQSDSSKSRYIAGLWNVRFTIEYELLWTANKSSNGKPCRRLKEYIAPSWSWASVEGEIEYTYKEDWDRTGDNHIGFVEDAEVITTDGTSTGPIKSGWIQVEGPLIEEPNGCSARDDESVPLPETVYCLTMFELWTDQKVWGLSLKKIEEGLNEGCYERIGTFTRYFDTYLNDDEEARAREQREYKRWTCGEKRLVKIV